MMQTNVVVVVVSVYLTILNDYASVWVERCWANNSGGIIPRFGFKFTLRRLVVGFGQYLQCNQNWKQKSKKIQSEFR